jgi:hypothetical protein
MSRSAVNRTLLAVAGIGLLGVGLLVLAGGLDLYGRLHLSMPGWWPLTSPDQPLVSNASRTRWVDRGWWWPTVITVLSLAVLGALGWLFAQLRRSGPSTVALPTPAGSGLVLHLRSRALEEAIEIETIALPEVDRVHARLLGRRDDLRVRAAIRLEAGGGPAEVLDRFYAGPLGHARTSLGLADLPAELRFEVAARRPAAGSKGPRVV